MRGGQGRDWGRAGAAVVTFAILVVGFAAFAHRLGRWNITAPIVFVVSGSVLSQIAEPPRATEVLWVKLVAEVTLALVLFHDAAQVRPRDIAAERALEARLLLIAFPLTILGGYLLAQVPFPAQPLMLSLLVAAALAPTDAGLGAATVLNPVVPVRIPRNPADRSPTPARPRAEFGYSSRSPGLGAPCAA